MFVIAFVAIVSFRVSFLSSREKSQNSVSFSAFLFVLVYSSDNTSSIRVDCCMICVTVVVLLSFESHSYSCIHQSNSLANHKASRNTCLLQFYSDENHPRSHTFSETGMDGDKCCLL